MKRSKRRLVADPDGDVEIHECGDGPDLMVLVHASMSGPRTLDDLAARLAAAGWRVAMPSLPGYGATASTRAEVPIRSIEAYRRRVMSVVRAACAANGETGRRLVLFGHSMGGLAALHAASAGPLLDAMAVYEPVAFSVLLRDDPADEAANAWDRSLATEAVTEISRGRTEPGVRRFIEAWGDGAWQRMPAPVRSQLVAMAPTLQNDIAFVRGDADLPNDFARIEVPTLLINGDRSPEVTRRICHRLAGTIQQAERATIAGAGHMAPAITAQSVSQLLLDWLRNAAPIS